MGKDKKKASEAASERAPRKVHPCDSFRKRSCCCCCCVSVLATTHEEPARSSPFKRKKRKEKNATTQEPRKEGREEERTGPHKGCTPCRQRRPRGSLPPQ